MFTANRFDFDRPLTVSLTPVIDLTLTGPCRLRPSCLRNVVRATFRRCAIAPIGTFTATEFFRSGSRDTPLCEVGLLMAGVGKNRGWLGIRDEPITAIQFRPRPIPSEGSESPKRLKG